MSGDAEAWLSKVRLCISETVAMRHPHPMEHIARMLVEPNFQESLGLPTAEYVRRHDLKQRMPRPDFEVCASAAHGRGGVCMVSVLSAAYAAARR